MEDLIKALTIFMKYSNESYPTHCEHEIMMITKVTQEEVSEEDIEILDDLGFRWNSEYDCFTSFKFGSA
jgi:hypothetical protein